MSIVADTNVLLSAVAQPQSHPGRIVSAILDERLSLVSTPRLWAEFERALGYPKVRQLIARHAGDVVVRTFVENLKRIIVFVADCDPEQRWIPNDPDDDWVIQCALTAGADWIVSGDRQLLALGTVGSVSIVTPAAFVADVLDRKH